MEVVETFELVLGLQRPVADRQQIDVVLQNTAEIAKGVSHAELVAVPTLEQSIDTEPDVNKLRDRTCVLVRKRELPEEAPSIAVTSLDGRGPLLGLITNSSGPTT